MSGKKDWEVADLLEEGIKARKRTESNLNNAIKSNNQSFNVSINSYGIYEFSCDGYPDYSRWVDFGIY